AEAAGMQAGDRIVSVDGREVETCDAMALEVATKGGRELQMAVDRGGRNVALRVTPNAVGRYEMGEIGIGPVLRPQIVTVRQGSPAERGGLRPGDAIVAVGERQGPSHEQVIEDIQASANTALPIVVDRGGERVTL